MFTDNVGIIKVSTKLLEDMLHIPDDHHIIDIYPEKNEYCGSFKFKIKGPTLPEVKIGDLIPEVKAILTKEKISMHFERID